MKTTIKLLASITCVAIIGVLASCSKENELTNNTQQNPIQEKILGKWQCISVIESRAKLDSTKYVYTEDGSAYYRDSTHYYYHIDTIYTNSVIGTTYDFRNDGYCIEICHDDTYLTPYKIIDSLIYLELYPGGTFTIETINDTTLVFSRYTHYKKLWDGGVYIVWNGTEWLFGEYQLFSRYTLKRIE